MTMKSSRRKGGELHVRVRFPRSVSRIPLVDWTMSRNLPTFFGELAKDMNRLPLASAPLLPNNVRHRGPKLVQAKKVTKSRRCLPNWSRQHVPINPSVSIHPQTLTSPKSDQEKDNSEQSPTYFSCSPFQTHAIRPAIITLGLYGKMIFNKSRFACFWVFISFTCIIYIVISHTVCATPLRRWTENLGS